MKFQQVLNEYKPYQNVAKYNNSLAHHLKDFIGKMDSMSIDELKHSFHFLAQKYSSEQKQREFKMNMEGMNKRRMMEYITNIYLRGAGMGTNWR